MCKAHLGQSMQHFWIWDSGFYESFMYLWSFEEFSLSATENPLFSARCSVLQRNPTLNLTQCAMSAPPACTHIHHFVFIHTTIIIFHILISCKFFTFPLNWTKTIATFIPHTTSMEGNGLLKANRNWWFVKSFLTIGSFQQTFHLPHNSIEKGHAYLWSSQSVFSIWNFRN